MKDNLIVSSAVIKRLPCYRRTLGELEKKKIKIISSSELGEKMGMTASQIRQDLHNFGSLGVQGYGYNVRGLQNQIGRILGLGKSYRIIIIGAGNIGRTITNFISFNQTGFDIIAIFDTNPKRIGQVIKGVEVKGYDKIKDFLSKHSIDIGIIATSSGTAQEVADALVNGGVKGIWNFETSDLSVPDHIAIQNVHLCDSLYLLTYHTNQKQSRTRREENASHRDIHNISCDHEWNGQR